MKRAKKTAVSALLLLSLLLSGTPGLRMSIGAYAAENGASGFLSAYGLGEEAASFDIAYTDSDSGREPVVLTADISRQGAYMVLIEYAAASGSVDVVECMLTVNGVEYAIVLDQSYHYDQYPFATDSRGEEVRPKLLMNTEWMVMPAYSGDGSSASPIIFELMQGENDISLTVVSGFVSIRKLTLVSAAPVPDYETYRSGLPSLSDKANTGHYETIEAEGISAMSARSIQLNSLSEAGLSPETYGRRVYNTIGGASWKYPGQWLEWSLTVPEDGFYAIAFKYQQNINNSLNAYRRVEIDGKVPFAELLNVAFPYTNTWERKVLGDDTPYLIYLSKGTHTLRLTSVNELYFPVYEALLAIAADIRALDIYLKGVTGLTTDKQVDTYRIYQLERYIPDLSEQLAGLSDAVTEQLNRLCWITGVTPDKFDTLRYEATTLMRYAEDLDLITKSYDALSRTQTNITAFAVTLNDQPLLLDTLSVKSPDQSFEKAHVGFFTQMVFFVKQLISSFTDDYGHSSAVSGKAVEVWVQRNRDYVNLMQQHADEYFTAQTGITVNVNYIPGQDILILANSAGTQPTLVSGIGRDVPFNFALRNAIVALDEFDDYNAFTASVPAGQMVPYHLAGHDYALPEEVTFNVMYYREDIFAEYDLSVPQTWEDAQRMVPTLQQNNMNFWLQWGDWLTFYYQFGMDPYTPDGMDIQLDSEEGFAVFKYWSEFYTKYNFPQRIGSFYQNFRYGDIPVGLSSLQDYFLMKLAAPELSGLWRIAPIPGIVDENGDIIRFQCGDQRGVMMFKTTPQEEADGWAFTKWWLDTETQINYALDLESAYGQEFRWYSSNPEVVKHIPWEEQDKQVILTQLAWFKGIPYTPGGSYLLEREMKNALSSVVIDKKNYRDMLENAIRATRKEMIITLQEFGFIDENGNVLKTLDMLPVPKPF